MFDRVGGAVMDGCGRRDGGGLPLVRHCRTSSRHRWGGSAAPGGLNRTLVVGGVPRTLDGRCRDEVGKQLVRRVSLRGEPIESPLTARCVRRPLPAPCTAPRPSAGIASPHRSPRLALSPLRYPSHIPLSSSHHSYPLAAPPPPCRSLLLDLFSGSRRRDADRRRVGRPRDRPPHPRVGGGHPAGAVRASGRRGRLPATRAARVARPRGLRLRERNEGGSG